LLLNYREESEEEEILEGWRRDNEKNMSRKKSWRWAQNVP
jgi:hypothetical protein